LDHKGNRESCLGAAQPFHRHSRHLASRSRHVSNLYFSLQVQVSRPLDRSHIAISNSNQFKRVLQEPMKAWTSLGRTDGKNGWMCDTPEWQDIDQVNASRWERGGEAYKMLIERLPNSLPTMKRAYNSAVRSTRPPWYGFLIHNCRTLSGLKVKAYQK
jgi:hypothetical protein